MNALCVCWWLPATSRSLAGGQDADIHKSVQIALAASAGLDEDRSSLYLDLILASLSEAARRELQAMDPAKYEYQSDFAKRFVAQGRAEGEVSGERSGRVALIIRQLAVRFGSPTNDVQASIAQASIEELNAVGERLLTAQTLQEALGSH